jgi:hypothetical protein
MSQVTRWACRVAPSLGALEAIHQEAWGTKDYDYSTEAHTHTVFFGLYDLRDYIALARHRGTKAVLWAGSDLNNLKHGFVFNDGKLKLLSKLFCGWFHKLIVQVLKGADHYVENIDEFLKLKESTGIKAKIVPSFLGKLEDWPLCYKPNKRPQVYISVSGDRWVEYGAEFIASISDQVPEVDFHIYGHRPSVYLGAPNFYTHGRVPKEQFNAEIKKMQCGLRLNESDGFSEITAKSVLMGQWPISRLFNKGIHQFEDTKQLISLLKALKNRKKPNIKGRNYYLKAINAYPWVLKPQKSTKRTGRKGK